MHCDGLGAGLDHAGIATQSVVERNLLKQEGLTRHDLGRDKFIDKVRELSCGHWSLVKAFGTASMWTGKGLPLGRPPATAGPWQDTDGLAHRWTRPARVQCLCTIGERAHGNDCTGTQCDGMGVSGTSSQ
jgi:hypothetical protein